LKQKKVKIIQIDYSKENEQLKIQISKKDNEILSMKKDLQTKDNEILVMKKEFDLQTKKLQTQLENSKKINQCYKNPNLIETFINNDDYEFLIENEFKLDGFQFISISNLSKRNEIEKLGGICSLDSFYKRCSQNVNEIEKSRLLSSINQIISLWKNGKLPTQIQKELDEEFENNCDLKLKVSLNRESMIDFFLMFESLISEGFKKELEKRLFKLIKDPKNVKENDDFKRKTLNEMINEWIEKDSFKEDMELLAEKVPLKGREEKGLKKMEDSKKNLTKASEPLFFLGK